MEISQRFIDSGHSISQVLEILKIPRSSYYYKPKPDPKKKGVAKSMYTRKRGGEFVSNGQVVEDIKEILSREFVDYGYLKITHWLRKNKEYIIDDKKVYRLMRENQLLNVSAQQSIKTKKEWVKEFVPKPSQSLEYFEMDIKYMYVHGKKRNALMLTVLDVESRWVLGDLIKWQMNQQDVIHLFNEIFANYTFPTKLFIRNDNGSQFVSEMVQSYFKDKAVTQEFIKPATPEQNAHIESYHSIVEKVICKNYEFDTLADLNDTMERFVAFYNRERIHSGIKYQSPKEYLETKGIHIDKDILKKTTFGISNKTEAGSAEEQPARDCLVGGMNEVSWQQGYLPFKDQFIQPIMP
jgi:transposase InsO family protein